MLLVTGHDVTRAACYACGQGPKLPRPRQWLLPPVHSLTMHAVGLVEVLSRFPPTSGGGNIFLKYLSFGI